ncbi:MAG: di-heme oxidoredictase family protein [Myxococcota bacterium]
MGLQRTGPGVCSGLIATALSLACGGSSGPAADASTTDAGSSTGVSVDPSSSTTTSTGADASTTGVADESSSSGGLMPAALEPGELRPGGDTTTDELGVGAFVQEAANLTLERRAQFEAGLQFFQLVWEVAPATPELDGLGPTFNAASCLGCHQRNGRGPIPFDDPATPAVLLRLADARGAPDPVLGDQLQPRSIRGVPAEGTLTWTEMVVDARAIDGARLERRALVPAFVPGPLGPPAATTLASPRVSMQLVGQGLLESVTDADIEAWEDPDDADADGISGRVARLSGGQIGRFGWKAAMPSVRHQTAAAFAGDLGITSDLHPSENCPSGQDACAAAPTGGAPELTPVRLDVTAAYVRLLGVPARRNGNDPDTLRGKTLFGDVGCDACHRPTFVTGDAAEPELTGQQIWPYTDLLLHDLGPELAQGGPEAAATAAEWRTPPLWGLGLLEVVADAPRRLLHDGRARTIAEAVAWHGGEAEASRDAYLELSAEHRALLDGFVDSL